MHVFIKASVSELKIHSALIAGRYRKLLRQMGVSRGTGYIGSSFSCAVIDILLKLGLVNIDLPFLLLHLQMFDGQLTFEDTEIGSCAPLLTIGRASYLGCIR